MSAWRPQPFTVLLCSVFFIFPFVCRIFGPALGLLLCQYQALQSGRGPGVGMLKRPLQASALIRLTVIGGGSEDLGLQMHA